MLAKKLKNAEIVSADSRQIYRDFDLSSGKVTKQEMENIPHHMLDIVNPGEYFSVVDFTELALEKIEDIYKRGNVPIVCGGTGFYIDSLLYDYQLPNVKKNDFLRKDLENKSQEELFYVLQKINPSDAEKIENNIEYRNNKHRMMRRIEVVNSLGYFPTLTKVARFSSAMYKVKIINIKREEQDLKKRIYMRLLERIDQGMLEEIERVKDKYNLSFHYLEKLGLEFKWTAKYLKGEISKEEMVERLNLETGQYAKRQISWFKRYEV